MWSITSSSTVGVVSPALGTAFMNEDRIPETLIHFWFTYYGDLDLAKGPLGWKQMGG